MANQYLPFATGGSANTMTYSAWASLSSIIANGFQSGVASSEQFNTLMRQVSVPASGLAQWASDTAGVNAVDDGSVTNFKALLNSAWSAKLAPYDAVLSTALYNRGSVAAAGYDGISTTGQYRGIQSGYSTVLLHFNSTDTSTGHVQIEVPYEGAPFDLRFRNKLDNTTWSGWSTFWTTQNFNPANYFPVTGGTVSGSVSATGSVAAGGGMISYGSYLFGETGNDTGHVWNMDGGFSAINNGTTTVAFRPTFTQFNVPASGITSGATANDSNFATTAHVTNKINNLFTASNGDTGWARASTGQIEQWGQVYIGDVLSGGASGTFTFPLAFPTGCNLCVVSVQDVNANGNVVITIGDPSTTSVTWRAGETSSTIQNATIHFYARGH